MKYGVVGSHVNLTSRIQSYTIGGQILGSHISAPEGLAPRVCSVTPLLAPRGAEWIEPSSSLLGAAVGLARCKPLSLKIGPEKTGAAPELAGPKATTMKVKPHLLGDRIRQALFAFCRQGAKAGLTHTMAISGHKNLAETHTEAVNRARLAKQAMRTIKTFEVENLFESFPIAAGNLVIKEGK